MSIISNTLKIMIKSNVVQLVYDKKKHVQLANVLSACRQEMTKKFLYRHKSSIIKKKKKYTYNRGQYLSQKKTTGTYNTA